MLQNNDNPKRRWPRLPWPTILCYLKTQWQHPLKSASGPRGKNKNFLTFWRRTLALDALAPLPHPAPSPWLQAPLPSLSQLTELRYVKACSSYSLICFRTHEAKYAALYSLVKKLCPWSVCHASYTQQAPFPSWPLSRQSLSLLLPPPHMRHERCVAWELGNN